MRAVVLALAICPGVAQADLFQVASAPQSVIVHPDLARVARSVSLEMPAGLHEIRLSNLPIAILPELTDASVTGATLQARVFRNAPTPSPEILAGTPDVQAAEAALDDAREALARHDDRVAEIRASAEAAKAQIAFLERLPTAELSVSVEDLRVLGQTIAADGTAARSAIIAAEAEARQLQADRRALEDALTLAQAAYDRVQEPFKDARELSLMVNVTDPGPVSLELEYWVHSVSWQPVYRLALDSDAGELTMERDVSIQQFTGEPWENVNLSVTTIAARGQTVPTRLFPRLLTSAGPDAYKRGVSVQTRSLGDVAESSEVLMQAEPVAEEATAQASVSGAGVVYTFDQPVTVRAEEAARVALAPLAFDVELTARAIPSRDTSGFRMLTFNNTSGERVLAGEAAAFVDGQTIGQIWLETIEAGEEVETGFGPIHGLLLERAVLDKQEGDRGIIARENRQREEVRITLENLTDRAWPITLADQVPYSEQEDLEINWATSPRATRENVDDQRGILEWDLTLAPGAKAEVRLDTNIRWPDGQILR